METSKIQVTRPDADYELLDSGDGEKLERFGKVIMSRPDPQSLWAKRLSQQEWEKADAYFTRDGDKSEWSFRQKLPEKWEIGLCGLKFWIKPTAFKHTGLFPEQFTNWEWLKGVIGAAAQRGMPAKAKKDKEIEVLNLFGYTGAATLACAQAGAKVVHIDGSKAAMTWARENAELSGLADKPIRWIVEDARAFVEREIRRGNTYDGIIMDPPAFGHGPENELWKIEDHFLALIESCKKLLKPQPLFFLINGYSAGYSAIAYRNNLLPLQEKFGGMIEIGELAIEESPVKGQGSVRPRLLPCGIFARWSAK